MYEVWRKWNEITNQFDVYVIEPGEKLWDSFQKEWTFQGSFLTIQDAAKASLKAKIDDCNYDL